MKYECPKCESTGKKVIAAYEDECGECGHMHIVPEQTVNCGYCFGKGGFDNTEDFDGFKRRISIDKIMAMKMMEYYKEPSFFSDDISIVDRSEPIKFNKVMRIESGEYEDPRLER